MIKKLSIISAILLSACSTTMSDKAHQNCSVQLKPIHAEDVKEMKERNKYIDYELARNEADFCKHIFGVYNRRNTLGVGGDTVKSLLGTWGTIVTGGDVSRVTNGVITAFDASKSSVNSNIYWADLTFFDNAYGS